MAEIGDRVQAPSRRIGQAPREGVVTGVIGTLLRVRWSTGEESTFTPTMGSLVVVGRARSRAAAAKGSGRTTKAAGSAKAPSKAPAKRSGAPSKSAAPTKRTAAAPTKRTAAAPTAKTAKAAKGSRPSASKTAKPPTRGKR